MPKAIAQASKTRPAAKEVLLAAAAQLIAEVGWGNVSSRMVAERAGVNNALVHYHFDSMEDLLRRAAARVMTEAFSQPTRAVWRRGDVTAGLQAAVRWLDRLDVTSPETGVLMESLMQSRRDPELQREGAAGLEALRTELAQAIGAAGGRLAAGGTRGMATLLLALLDGLLLHRVVDPTLELAPAARSLRTLLASEGARAGQS
jgi:AcrR family transcriptional regulator